MKDFPVNFEDTPFLQTSKTAAHPNRLNWRTEILLTRNLEAIIGKSVLDLASHDGRFSYACLKLGAKNVTGVEGRRQLVESANENLKSLGCNQQDFSFIQGDLFDYLQKLSPQIYMPMLRPLKPSLLSYMKKDTQEIIGSKTWNSGNVSF